MHQLFVFQFRNNKIEAVNVADFLLCLRLNKRLSEKRNRKNTMKKVLPVLALLMAIGLQANAQIDSLLDPLSFRLTAHRLLADEAQLFIDYEFDGTNAIELKVGAVYPNAMFVPFAQENLRSNWGNYKGYFVGLAFKHYYLFTPTNQLYWSAGATFKHRNCDTIAFETVAPFDPNYVSSQRVRTLNLKFELGEDVGSQDDQFFFTVYGGLGASVHWVNASYQKMTPIVEEAVDKTWQNNNKPRFSTAIEFDDAGVFFTPSLHFGVRAGFRL